MSSEPISATATYWRIALRPMAAYCAASLVAGFVVFPMWGLITIPPTSAVDLFGLLASGLLLAPYIAVVAVIPTILLLTLVRMMKLRRGITDAIGGGIVGALTVTVIYQIGNVAFDFDDSDLFRAAQYGLAGIAGGLTFWLANGRPQSGAAENQMATQQRPKSLR